MIRSRTMVCAATAAALVALSSLQADAACTRLAFSVNDYGKVGPTNDAKDLLDKYIQKWTAQRGIKTYKVGPKSVKCELFLDFIVFDEYTCEASASVCWAGSVPSGGTVSEASAKAPASKSARGGERKAPAAGTATAKGPAAPKVTTGSVEPAAVQAPSPPPAAVPPPVPAPAAASDVVAPLPPAKTGD